MNGMNVHNEISKDMTLDNASSGAQSVENIEQFFNLDGTLTHIPVRPAKKIAVLSHIAKNLEKGTKYSEKEINELISKFHPDTAAIRRHMIEFGILERDNTSTYWLK